MTHLELLSMLKKQLPRLNRSEGQILKGIIAGLGKKDDSLYAFYEELSTNGNILSLSNIKKTAEKYSVPLLYKDMIEARFLQFKTHLKAICVSNQNSMSQGLNPGYDAGKWTVEGAKMFQTTEIMTIDKVGGIRNICANINNVGYFDFLKKMFLASATETSTLKYSLLLKSDPTLIGDKNGG